MVKQERKKSQGREANADRKLNVPFFNHLDNFVSHFSFTIQTDTVVTQQQLLLSNTRPWCPLNCKHDKVIFFKVCPQLFFFLSLSWLNKKERKVREEKLMQTGS